MTILDKVFVTTITTGTGSQINLGSNISGYQTFANAGAVSDASYSYGIVDQANTWEVGTATYVSNSLGYFLTNRTPKASSNTSGGPINLSGNAHVYATFLDTDYNTLTPANSVVVASNTVVNASGFFYNGISASLPATWFNVKSYGATGNGTTDDTAAINSAISALISAGGGVLYFPIGTYLVSSALTTITVDCIITGDGMGAFSTTQAATHIACSNATANVITTATDYVKIQNLSMWNTTTATDGAGVSVLTSASGSYAVRTDFENVLMSGFYINADIQVGAYWVMDKCVFQDPVYACVKIQNTVNNDRGDWCISNCLFATIGAGSVPYGIYQLSGGGGKIVNSKVNTNSIIEFGYYGQPGGSSILLFNNCSIEGAANAGIYLTGGDYVVINGCEFSAATSTVVPIYSNGQYVCIDNIVINALSTIPYAIDIQGANTFVGSVTGSNLTTVVNPASVPYSQVSFGGGTPGGSNGQVQFNDNGSFAGANLTFSISSNTSGDSTAEYDQTLTAISTNPGANGGLMLRETGDQYGNVSLLLANRYGLNGAIFTNESVPLVDFAFLANATQRNMRYELRNTQFANSLNTTFEFQFGDVSNAPSTTVLNLGDTVATSNLTWHYLPYTTVNGYSVSVGITTLNTAGVFCGSNVTVNTSGFHATSNTGLTLGSSFASNNGYTWLPNGLLLQWGAVFTNSSVGDFSFPVAFPTNMFNIQTSVYTPNPDTSYSPYIINFTTTTANVRTLNATSMWVYWTAIGN